MGQIIWSKNLYFPDSKSILESHDNIILQATYFKITQACQPLPCSTTVIIYMHRRQYQRALFGWKQHFAD